MCRLSPPATNQRWRITFVTLAIVYLVEKRKETGKHHVTFTKPDLLDIIEPLLDELQRLTAA